MTTYSYSNACSKYGASMGRDSTRQRDLPTEPVKLYLQRVRLDSGGYDPGGAYWGHGEPLYVAFDLAGDVQHFVRAVDRPMAKRLVAEKIKGARFYK
jgi:hypothetical protein